MTKVINLFGGSGIGKSTTAAHLFAEMKYRGLHCELVREYVKSWAWENKPIGPFDQMYLLGKQSKYESILYGKVDYIVTDSPLLMCPIYERYYSGKDCVGPAAVNFLEDAKSKGVHHLNFLLKRFAEFDTRGRFETAEQAQAVDVAVKNYLEQNNIDFHELTVSDRTRVDEILAIVLSSQN